jgi:hypothetical protein
MPGFREGGQHSAWYRHCQCGTAVGTAAVDKAAVDTALPPYRPCGELADCGDFKRATRPVPAQYLPSDYIDVGAVVPRMGNHLLDSQSPELKDSLPFATTFIYGAYEGELIFWEPMITLDFLQKT